MLDKLRAADDRYEEINNKLSNPDVISNQDEYRKLMKEHSELEEIVTKYREYVKINDDLKGAREVFESETDADMKELAEIEITEAEEKISQIEDELKILLLPKDPNDDRSVIVEIRGGAGGEEAALFAGVLFRMYTRYAERKRWKVELLDSNATELGGFKEVIFSIDAHGAFSKLKFESGVHRVQRVPATEAGGRIHTSTVTVAVLPEVEDVDVEINPDDLQIDTYRAGGAGGQHVNKTESAIRITHLPTGIVVTCQDERSQHKNKDKAMKILRSKIYEIELQKQELKLAAERRSQVGTGDRSERIRTYNYSQGRVTDHRINVSLYKLEQFLDGDMDELIEALVMTEQTRKLAAG